MRVPEKQYMNNCKVSRELYANRVPWGTKHSIKTGESTAEGPTVRMMVGLAQDAPEGIGEEPFSFYDAVICDAVYTIFRTGAPKFTLSDLFKVMVADDGGRLSATEQRAKELRRAIERLSYTEVAIDYRKQAEARGLEADVNVEGQWIVHGSLLPIEVDARNGAFWFREDEDLPLYHYAEEIRQIVQVDSLLLSPANYVKAKVEPELQAELLDGVSFRNEKEMILLKRALLQRLAVIRNEHNSYMNKRILYYDEHKSTEGLLPQIGVNKADYAQEKLFEPTRGRVRFPRPGWENRVREIDERVRAILSAYAQGGYIGGYSRVRSGDRGLARGVDIIPGPNTKEAERWRSQQALDRVARHAAAQAGPGSEDPNNPISA